MEIKLIEIDSQTIPAIAEQRRGDGDRLGLLAASPSSPVDVLGPGDVLDVNVFEIGATLFGGGRTALGEQTAAIPIVAPSASGGDLGSGILIDGDGNISIPYGGTIHAAGLTAPELQLKIANALRGKSQSPQVLVSLRKAVASSVILMGAVQKPGRQALSLAHDRLLDLIAEAGGITTAVVSAGSTTTGIGPQDYIVRVTRNKQTFSERLGAILPGTSDDILLAPGDRIEVIRQPKTIIVFGATDRVSQMPFEGRTMHLAEALARIGGPSDARADPRSVFVFRYAQGSSTLSQAAAAEALDQPTVYRLNMMQASSYFLAQKFAMQDNDVLYISNSSSNQPTKLAQIINLLFSPVFSIRAATQ